MAENPKQKLTTWLTEGFPEREKRHHLDRTRVMATAQKRWYSALLAVEDPYFTRRVEIDQELMMAFKGKRSDDVVNALMALVEEEARETGLRPVEEYLKKKRPAPPSTT